MSESQSKKLLEKIIKAIQEAAREVRIHHKLNGEPLIVSDGKGGVRLIPPAEIKID